MINLVRDFKPLLEQRLIESSQLSASSNLIQILLGPRQIGKTTAVQQIAETWNGPVVFASADLPYAPQTDWIQAQWQKARSYQSSETLLILDEIQKIDQWSSVAKVLIDEERARKSKMRVVMLGSASWLIQAGLQETLAGRFEIIKAYHWSLSECQQAFGWDLRKYLKFGGYPVPAGFIEDKERWQQFVLNSIIEPMLSKDILPLKHVAKPALFRQAFSLAMSYPSQEVAIHKFLGQLQESGNSSTIRNYLEMMVSGFSISLLEKYSTRALSKKSSSPKLLPLCPALIHAYSDPDRLDSDPDWFGRVFETAIGAHLSKAFDRNLFYWREGKDEVDFVVAFNQKVIAIEVKSGRKKSSSGLRAFQERFHGSVGVVFDLELGERFLQSTNPRQFVLNCL